MVSIKFSFHTHELGKNKLLTVAILIMDSLTSYSKMTIVAKKIFSPKMTVKKQNREDSFEQKICISLGIHYLMVFIVH